MNGLVELKRISVLLGRCIHNIISDNNSSDYSLNYYVEPVFLKVFKIIFDTDTLIKLKKGFPGIDLGDYSRRFSIQITSDNDIDKIKETLDKFISNHLFEYFDKVYIFIIAQKKKYNQTAIDKKIQYSIEKLKKSGYDKKVQFNFNVAEDIISIYDIRDILQENNNLDSITKIKDILESELVDKVLPNKYKKNLSTGAIFKLGIDIEPANLLPYGRSEPSNGFNEYYLVRYEVDEALYNRLEEKRFVILKGKPLTGKSRAILELLNSKFQDANVILLQNPNGYRLSYYQEQIIDERATIFIFDENENYFSEESFTEFIKELWNFNQTNPNTIYVLITCNSNRSSELTTSLGYIEQQVFSMLTIPQLTDAQKKELISQGKNTATNVSFYDDRIGAYFLPVSIMKSRYDSLGKIEKNILRSYKVIGYWRRRNRYNQKVIREHTEKYDKKISDREWEEAINNLIESGLVLSTNDYRQIKIDPAYEEELIAPGLTEAKCSEEILKYHGCDTINLNKLILRANSDDVAWENFSKFITNKIEPSFFTFFILHNRFSNSSKVRTHQLNHFIHNNKNPSNILNWNLFHIDLPYEERLDFLNKELNKGIKPDTFTLFAFARRATTFRQCWNCYKLIQKVDSNILCENLVGSFIHKPFTDFVFDELWNEVYPELAKYFKTQNDIWTYIYTLFLLSAPDFETASQIFYKSLENGIQLRQFFFTKYIKKAETFDDLEIIIEQATEVGTDLSNTFYNTLLTRPVISNSIQLNKILDLIKHRDAFTYECIFNNYRVVTDEQAWLYFLDLKDEVSKRKILAEEIKMNTYRSIMARKITIEQSLDVLKTAMTHGKCPDYLFLCSKKGKSVIPNDVVWFFFETCMDYIKDSKLPVIKVRHSLYGTILKRDITFSQAKMVFNYASQNNILLRSPYLNLLLDKATNFKEVIEVCKLVKQIAASINCSFWRTVLKHCVTTREIITLLEWFSDIALYSIDPEGKDKVKLIKTITFEAKKIVEKETNIDLINTIYNLTEEIDSHLDAGFQVDILNKAFQSKHFELAKRIFRKKILTKPEIKQKVQLNFQFLTAEHAENPSISYLDLINEFHELRKFLSFSFKKDEQFAKRFYKALFSKVDNFDDAEKIFEYLKIDSARFTWFSKYINPKLEKLAKSNPQHEKKLMYFISNLKYH